MTDIEKVVEYLRGGSTGEINLSYANLTGAKFINYCTQIYHCASAQKR